MGVNAFYLLLLLRRMGDSNSWPLTVRVLGIFDMLTAWFTRRLKVDGEVQSFDGRHPFRAFALGRTIYYFRPFVPRSFKEAEKDLAFDAGEVWMALHGYGGTSWIGNYLRKDRQALFLHEASHIALNSRHHTEGGLMAPGFIPRNRTTTWKELEGAWGVLGNGGASFRFEVV